MATLYEIDKKIMDCITENGEFIDITGDEELMQKLEALQIERKTKIENICLFIKNLKSDIEAYKAEKMEFAKKQQAAETKLKSLQNYLFSALEGEKFKTTRASVSYRKSQKVVVDDYTLLPSSFVSYEPKVDKTMLKLALKNGEEIDGAKLEENLSIIIK